MKSQMYWQGCAEREKLSFLIRFSARPTKSSRTAMQLQVRLTITSRTFGHTLSRNSSVKLLTRISKPRESHLASRHVC